MRPFLTRILICLVPVLMAAWAVGAAANRYRKGEGGFKLGVDLVGGTILTYEIDDERQQQLGITDTGENTSEKLAAALKRRIDPADLLNVTIRPIGTNRVEIVLPSGSVYKQQAEETKYLALLEEVRNHWRDELVGVEFQTTRSSARELAAEIKSLVDLAHWRKFLADLEDKTPALKGKLTGLETGAIGDLVERVRQNGGVPAEADLRKQFEAAYKPADLAEVAAYLHGLDEYNRLVERRDASGSDVQRVKDLIRQVGSLEFSILANDADGNDAEAIKAAQAYFADASHKARLEELAQKGLPPPPPPGSFTIADTNREDTRATYAWYELAREERKSRGLNNELEGKDPHWQAVADARAKGLAYLDERGGRVLLYSRKCVNINLTLPQREEKKYEYFVLCRTSDSLKVGGEVSIFARPDHDRRGNNAIGFQFNGAGASQFGTLTENNLPQGSFKRQLAVILDNLVINSPSLNVRLDSGGIIERENGFPKEDVDHMVMLLRSGALPAMLKQNPSSENLIGPTLGADTIDAGTKAVLIAFLAVLVFMCLYYRFAGFVASVALLANLLLTVAGMVVLNATFTLPGLAGLVLMLGMAVDANVLIYERLREERDKGASLAMAIRNGYDRALPTIIDTHLSSIFTAIVLYAVGNDQLKGFGVSLTLGLIISLFTSLIMTRLMFDIWLAKGWLTKLSMARFFSKPNINFMAVRYYWFTATAILTVIGLAVFIARVKDGAGLNIDFTGGTAVTARLQQPKDMGQLRALFEADHQKQRLQVQSVRQADEAGYQFLVQYQDGAPVPITMQEKTTAAALQERASVLPNWSVEQIFHSGDTAGEGQSHLFTVRTSEKERNLVLTTVDRLLSADGQPLLQKATASYDTKLENFDRKQPVVARFTAPVTPEYFRSVLIETLQNAGVKGTPPPVFGIGRNQAGAYDRLSIDLGGSQFAGVEPAKLREGLEQALRAFNTRPQPEKLENFDAALAAETQTKAFWAILISWVAILAYLWFRFGSWTFGAAAVVCLIHDLCFTLGMIAFCHYIVVNVPWLANLLRIEDFKIDLQTVAALLTLVGYSVNDTIVVFDRIREVRGKSPLLTPQMINDSVNQTLSRTILAATTVWLVVLVLYFFGGEGLHLFSFVMVVGVIVGTYSSIYVASPLLLIFGEGKPAPVRAARPVPATAGA